MMGGGGVEGESGWRGVWLEFGWRGVWLERVEWKVSGWNCGCLGWS